MTADYTYAPAPVLEETTAEFAIGVAGILRDTTTNAPSQLYDLNGSPVSSIVVGPKGAHSAFKADIPNGILDFGSVLIPSASLEQQAAAFTAVTTANDAAAVAAEASATAAAAVATANATASLIADAVTAGDVGTLIAEDTANLIEVVRYSFTANSWQGKVRPPTERPVLFVHPQSARPALNGTTAGGTLAAVPGKDYLAESVP